MNKNTSLSSVLNVSRSAPIKNRLFKSAMSEQLGDKQHNPTSALVTLYDRWARGGTGLLITGNVMVDRNAIAEPANVVLDAESDLSIFKQWAAAGQQHGARIWMQLNHPGKQIPNYLAKTPVAPSAVPLEEGLNTIFNTPRALAEDEILAVVQQFANAARLAKQCGFDGVQIHSAHGYLISQFLSSRHNKRDDQWGGSLENRMRFLKAIYKAIREEVGETYPVGIKLNSADYMKGGFSEDESMQVVETLGKLGIDLIEVSGGTYESPSMVGHKVKPSTLKREAYFLSYAEQVRQRIDTTLVVTGGFRSTKAMVAALQSGATDMIGVARPLAVDPDLPNKAMNDDSYRIELPKPSTGLKLLDKMFMLDLTWFESQLARMGEGKEAKHDLSAWSTVWTMTKSMGVAAFRKRRA